MIKRPKNVPEGSQPFQLVGTAKYNESGKDSILWIGPNHEKLGFLVFNPNGVERLQIKGRFE
jgi:hypothetical protein